MSEEVEAAKCSFCGVEKSADNPLISGNEGMICEECVELAHQVVASWGRKRQSASMIDSLKTPRQIKQHLDDYVIGQDDAKETLSVAVYNHYMRLLNQSQVGEDLQAEAAPELEKSNVLIAGPSGTGKTLLVKSLAKVIGVPIVIADATTLTQAGYVGDDVDSVIQRLLEAADGDVERAQWGIVYIDEIDKLARVGAEMTAVRDVSGEGVQQALLKMVEGSQVKVSKGDKRRGADGEQMLDTTHILFIVGGAFPRLEKIIAERLQSSKRGIGFHAGGYDSEPQQKSLGALYRDLQSEDLQQFGIIPEMIGRFPILTFLEELDVDALLRILKEPKNALVKQYQQLFLYQGVALEFSDAALRQIAQKALDRGTGARGLRGIIEAALRKTMFELPSKQGVERCVVDEDTVNQAAQSIVVEVLGTDIDELVEGEVLNSPGDTDSALPPRRESAGQGAHN